MLVLFFVYGKRSWLASDFNALNTENNNPGSDSDCWKWTWTLVWGMWKNKIIVKQFSVWYGILQTWEYYKKMINIINLKYKFYELWHIYICNYILVW